MARVEKIIRREDGSEVRIVATEMFGEGLYRSVDFYVHRREDALSAWKLCSKSPHPDWRSMSVDEYVRHGRPEFLRFVWWGDIFKVMAMLRPASQAQPA